MDYPKFDELYRLLEQIKEYSNLKHEYRSSEIHPFVLDLENLMKNKLAEVQLLQENEDLKRKEPDDLAAIRLLRKDGVRKLWDRLPADGIGDKLGGALLGRFVGNILGVPVELWEPERMKNLAACTGMSFPPLHYWEDTENTALIQPGQNHRRNYTRTGINGVPVDDDLTYTILGLLTLEKYGFDFTTEDVAVMWEKYLPYACTAESVALENIKNKIPADRAADLHNPYCQWIGADIRSDPWGYCCAGNPEKAAELAYRDASLSHRRNGVYGAMFFAAVQAAAFAVSDAVSAIKIGMTEIPSKCSLYKDIKWALETGETLRDYADARKAVDQRFGDMSPVHTNNNACLTIFGLMIGKNDFSKVISQTVAMGMDNDCTAATAGSIIGAILGRNAIPSHWHENFNNQVNTYLNHAGQFEIEDIIQRFERQLHQFYK